MPYRASAQGMAHIMVALSVAGIMVVLIVADIIMSRLFVSVRLSERGRVRRGDDKAPALDGSLDAGISQGMFHHRGHTWVHWRPEGAALIGADDLLHRVIGRIDEVRPPPLGEQVKQGEKAVMLRQNDRVLYLTSPVTGMVTAVNPELENAPELIKSSPYDKGWIFETAPSNPEEDLLHLVLADRARTWIARESRRIRFFIDARLKSGENRMLGERSADINGILEYLSDETWVLFKDQFIYQREWRS